MRNIIVAGPGTDVGKTVVSAILVTLLKANYWKPIQCGRELDTVTMKQLIDEKKHHIYEPAYSLKAPVSPHQAAALENISIQVDSIIPPKSDRPLIIEGVGGIFVPLTKKFLSIELFKTWDCEWVLVSKHYLGSINHTLLTLDALQKRNISISGVIFNGEPNPYIEQAILEFSKLPCLGRLLPENKINQKTIQRYARKWKI